MSTPDGFVMFAQKNHPYSMYGIFLHPHNSFVPARIKALFLLLVLEYLKEGGLHFATKCVVSWPT